MNMSNPDKPTENKRNPFQSDDLHEEGDDGECCSSDHKHYEKLPSVMTGSYTEISELHYDQDDFDNLLTPSEDREPKTSFSKPPRPATLVCERRKTTFPYNLEGTVSVDGNMTHFVAENLEYKIKIASPVTKVETSISSTKSIPSSSESQSQRYHSSFQTNTNQADINAIEIEAQYLAASVDNLTENLCNLLHSISSITADNVDTYKNAVNKLTDCMDGNIKCMYTIMAKTEEISNSMKPTEQIAGRIRELKRLVDLFESNI